MKKLLLSLFLLGGFLLSFSTIDKAFAAEEEVIQGWLKEDGNWYFYDKNGNKLYGKTYIDGKIYYFDNDTGAMITGSWIEESYYDDYFETTFVDWYYANSNGELKVNTWYLENGKWYYFDEDGVMVTGIRGIGNKYYFFDYNTGVMKTGWIKDTYEYGDTIEEYWFYANSNGELYLDKWLKSGSNWYYFTPWGEMATGFEVIGDKTYYFDTKTGAMKTGWFKETYHYEDTPVVEWYYASSSGEIYIDKWLKDGSNWYYFNSWGEMETGPNKINGKLYLFKENGALANAGWQSYKGDWYYTNKDGIAYTGWKQINGTWYYLNEFNGAMYTGVLNLDGKLFYLNENGSWNTKQGWVEDKDGNWFYVNGNGTLKTGWAQIGGIWYYFNPSGGELLY